MGSHEKLDTGSADEVDFDFFDSPRSDVGKPSFDFVDATPTPAPTATPTTQTATPTENKIRHAGASSSTATQNSHPHDVDGDSVSVDTVSKNCAGPIGSDLDEGTERFPHTENENHKENRHTDGKKIDVKNESDDTDSLSISSDTSSERTADLVSLSDWSSESDDIKYRVKHKTSKPSSGSDCSEPNSRHKKKAWVCDRSVPTKQRRHKASRTQDKATRGRLDRHQHSDSDTDDSYTSSDVSDVTDVSPLVSPRDDWQSTALTRKPPKSPLTSKNAVAARKTQDPSQDAIDLKLLMQAVLELEEDGSVSQYSGSWESSRLCAPHGQNRKNFTFSDDQVRTIDRENQRLMSHIMRTGDRKARAARQNRHRPTHHATPSAVNRVKDQQRIDTENQAFLHRLQSAQPSHSLRRETLLSDYSRQTVAGVSTHVLNPSRMSLSRRSRCGTSCDDASVTSSTQARRMRSAASSVSSTSTRTRGATARRKWKRDVPPRPEWQAGW